MTRGIILLFDLLNVFLLFRFILGCEFRKTRSSIVIGAGVITASFIVMVFYFDVLPYNVLWLFSHSICILPAVLLRGNSWNLLGLGVAYWEISMPLIYLANGMMLVFFKSRAFFANADWYTICAQGVTSVILCLLTSIFYRKRGEIYTVVMRINPFVYILFSFILSIFPLEWIHLGTGDSDDAMVYQGANEIKDAITAMITIGFMIAVICILYQRKMLKREMALKERCIAEQVEQYRLMGSAHEELRKFRHDFYKHMDVLTDLYDKKEMKELGQYLRQIYQVKERLNYIRTGNMICDAVANRYDGKCRASGIQLRFSGFFSKELSIAMTDLCVILSNALENAYEATCSYDGEREIICKIGNKGDFLFITIWNPACVAPVIIDGQMQTTKADGKNHGIGTKNMQETAIRNGGKVYWEYHAKRQIVTTRIELKNL